MKIWTNLRKSRRTEIVEGFQLSLKDGLKELLSNRNVLLICFAYSLSQGIMGTWMGVMVLNLRPLHISDQAGKIIKVCSSLHSTSYKAV